MTPNAERVFFDEADIYISQVRIITPDGRTFPTGALRSAFPSEEREGGCLNTLVAALFACLALAGGISLIIGMRVLIFAGARLAASAGIDSAIDAVEDRTGERVGDEIVSIVSPGTTWKDYDWAIIAAVLGVVAIGVGVFGLIRTMRRRRRRHIAIFLFGPGGAGVATSRQEYVVRDYDGEMIQRLITAAHEASLAAQQR